MKSKLLPFLAAGLMLAGSLHAQTPAAPKLTFPQPSPASTLKQQVGITDIEVNYSRPSMKGRKVFGGLVPYGEVWRTGANSATKITFSTPVKFGGVDIAAGAYELFTIPGEKEWTVILQSLKERPQWGSYAYDAKNDSARATVKAAQTAWTVETFSIWFNDLRDNSASLNFTWENTHVSVPITIDTVALLAPQIEAAMASNAEKKPYFQAAMFYFENGLDLKKSLEWMDAGLAANPKAYWMIYRKGLILAKAGDKAAAKAAAEQSLAMAEQESGNIRDEYVRLNKTLLESLK